jgi:hypothetical protein
MIFLNKISISSKQTNLPSLSTNTSLFFFKLHQHKILRIQWNTFFFNGLPLATLLILLIKYHLFFSFHIIYNHNHMRYQQVYALLIFGQERRKTYKKVRLITWVNQRKDKQVQKSSLKIICFRLTFLAQVVKICNVCIIFMYTCNVNVISTRYEASFRDTYHWKNAQLKNIMLKAQKLPLVQHYKVNMIYFQSQSLN